MRRSKCCRRLAYIELGRDASLQRSGSAFFQGRVSTTPFNMDRRARRSTLDARRRPHRACERAGANDGPEDGDTTGPTGVRIHFGTHRVRGLSTSPHRPDADKPASISPKKIQVRGGGEIECWDRSQIFAASRTCPVGRREPFAARPSVSRAPRRAPDAGVSVPGLWYRVRRVRGPYTHLRPRCAGREEKVRLFWTCTWSWAAHEGGRGRTRGRPMPAS